jgi:exonuclease SbcD
MSLLCMHQIVEGAKVGPRNYTFRTAPDVIRGKDLPTGCAAVLSGHIHRAQTLTRDLTGRPLSVPVLYPGSIERTSFAERDERKGYLLVNVVPSQTGAGTLHSYRFIPLPTRPMSDIEIRTNALDTETLRSKLIHEIARHDPDSVVRIKLKGPTSDQPPPFLTAEFLRSIAPPTMNIHLAGGFRPRKSG